MVRKLWKRVIVFIVSAAKIPPSLSGGVDDKFHFVMEFINYYKKLYFISLYKCYFA